MWAIKSHALSYTHRAERVATDTHRAREGSLTKQSNESPKGRTGEREIPNERRLGVCSVHVCMCLCVRREAETTLSEGENRYGRALTSSFRVSSICNVWLYAKTVIREAQPRTCSEQQLILYVHSLHGREAVAPFLLCAFLLLSQTKTSTWRHSLITMVRHPHPQTHQETRAHPLVLHCSH